MINPPQRLILLIISSIEENEIIRRILVKQDYQVVSVTDTGQGIQKAMEINPDLIICQHEMEFISGFRVYNLLKTHLLKRGTSFFIYSNKFDKEEILIGLEVGIDNFIFGPVDETTLLHKIENQTYKIDKMKSDVFKNNFETTPVAKFILENNQLIAVNSSFSKLLEFPSELLHLPALTEVFDLSENPTNRLNLHKYVNGLLPYCYLKSISTYYNNKCFDILLCNYGSTESGWFLGEVVSVERGKNGMHDKLMEDQSGLDKLRFSHSWQKEELSVQLTPREMEVLDLSAQGLPIKQIAARLDVSKRTVEKHRANILDKANANNIVEVVYKFKRFAEKPN